MSCSHGVVTCLPSPWCNGTAWDRLWTGTRTGLCAGTLSKGSLSIPGTGCCCWVGTWRLGPEPGSTGTAELGSVGKWSWVNNFHSLRAQRRTLILLFSLTEALRASVVLWLPPGPVQNICLDSNLRELIQVCTKIHRRKCKMQLKIRWWPPFFFSLQFVGRKKKPHSQDNNKSIIKDF